MLFSRSSVNNGNHILFYLFHAWTISFPSINLPKNNAYGFQVIPMY